MSELNNYFSGSKPLSVSGRYRQPSTRQGGQTFATYTDILNISAENILVRYLNADIRFETGSGDRGVRFIMDGITYESIEALNSSTTTVGGGTKLSDTPVSCKNLRIQLLCSKPMKAGYGVSWDAITYKK